MQRFQHCNAPNIPCWNDLMPFGRPCGFRDIPWSLKIIGLVSKSLPRQCQLMAPLRHADCIEQGPLSGATRKSFAHTQFFSVWPRPDMGLTGGRGGRRGGPDAAITMAKNKLALVSNIAHTRCCTRSMMRGISRAARRSPRSVSFITQTSTIIGGCLQRVNAICRAMRIGTRYC